MYQERIVIDPEILVGKPVIKGTRIPVELVLKHLAQDLDLKNLFEAYPRLTTEDVKACLEYAWALVEDEEICPAPAQLLGAELAEDSLNIPPFLRRARSVFGQGETLPAPTQSTGTDPTT